MTQDVNHILNAMRILCQNASDDLDGIEFDQTQTDYKLSKAIQFRTVRVMKDLIQLKNLYPSDFKIHDPPNEKDIAVKFSGKGYSSSNAITYEDFQYIKATGNLVYGVWDGNYYFAVQDNESYLEKDMNHEFDVDEDFIDMV